MAVYIARRVDLHTILKQHIYEVKVVLTGSGVYRWYVMCLYAACIVKHKTSLGSDHVVRNGELRALCPV